MDIDCIISPWILIIVDNYGYCGYSGYWFCDISGVRGKCKQDTFLPCKATMTFKMAPTTCTEPFKMAVDRVKMPLNARETTG